MRRLNDKELKLIHDWIKALKSGEYGQALGTLRNEHNEFCCLGVLCELDPDLSRDFDDNCYKSKGGHDVVDDDTDHHDDLLERLGLDGITLADLNDNESYRFPQIAQHIENKLKKHNYAID